MVQSSTGVLGVLVLCMIKGANTLLGLYCLLRVLGQTGTSYKEALGCCTPAC